MWHVNSNLTKVEQNLALAELLTEFSFEYFGRTVHAKLGSRIVVDTMTGVAYVDDALIKLDPEDFHVISFQ